MSAIEILALIVCALSAVVAVLALIKGGQRGPIRDEMVEKFDELSGLVSELSENQTRSVAATNATLEAVSRSVEQAGARVDSMRNDVTTQLAANSQNMAQQLQTSTQAMNSRLEANSRTINEQLQGNSKAMNAQLEANSRTLNEQLQGNTKTMNEQLGLIRQDNQRQLDEIRATVDERLTKTLNDRLSVSFQQINENLEAVYKGLGDMKSLAAGVGDLKKTLSNVKTRGILGEVQLGAILKELLTPAQYEENVATKPGSTERVEFAVKLPVEQGEPILLPIDAKFPGELYSQLCDALEAGDPDQVKALRKQLENRIKSEAKDISTKYISVPDTTNFAIMFLPFEGLYAEVVNMPGLVETLQRDYRVNVAGPSTMSAILGSLQMSYQTFALQRRTDEVLRVLQAVKAELPKYQKELQKAKEQIDRAGRTVDSIITTRTNVMERKLNSISDGLSADDPLALPEETGDEE